MAKVLTRDEQQARTREVVVSAAERVFLERGYNATTMAQIAAEAGRTHGAIYGHFTGKETLCRQVLRSHFEHVLRDLAMATLAADGITAKLSAAQRVWEDLLDQPAWIRLAADFVIATRSDADQESSNRELVDSFITGIRMLLVAQAGSQGQPITDPDVLDQAVAALLGTGIGLAVGHALGATTREMASAAFIANVEVWVDRFGAS